MIGFFVFFTIFISSFATKTAIAKSLPVGSCIANKFLCNSYEENIDPWEIRCSLGAFLRIEKIGKRSYKTSCIENTFNCRSFVKFKDVEDFYYSITCPVEKSNSRSGVLLPRR